VDSTYPTLATRFGEAKSGLVLYTNAPDSRSKLVEFGIVEQNCLRKLVGASLSLESVYERHKTRRLDHAVCV